MAVNTQKLLPSAKTTSVLAKANVGKIFSNASIKTKKINTNKIVGPLAKRNESGQIVNTLTDIDTRLKLILGEEKNQQKKEKKEKERKDFAKAEEKLEAPKEAKKFRLPGISVPGTSFLDRIKRFLFFTALGWLFTKFQNQLPKLLAIINPLAKVYGVAENIFKTLLTGLVNFIDTGYKVYDQIRKFSKEIGGQKLQKNFDEFSNNFNTALNAILTLGASLLVKSKPVPQKKNGGLVSKMQSGGPITRGGKFKKEVSRTIKISKRKPQKIKPQKSQPGKDVGGQKKIEILYPNPKQTSDAERKPSPYRALTKTSKKLKEIPFVGALMGAAVDVALGQKPDPKVYKSIGNGIEYLIQTAANQKVTSTMGALSRAIIGMADGGTVPSLGMVGGQGEMINKVLGVLIQTRVNEALQGVRSEINKQQSGADGGGSEGGAGGGGGAGGYAEGEKNFVASKEIYDYIRSKGVSHTHAMGMLANIQAESSFNAGAIGDSGTSGGLFQHHAERFEGMKSYAGKDWAKNWKRQVDYALREDAGKQYTNKEFKNAQEASAWFTLNFERPSNKEEKARQRLENLNNFNVDGSWKGSQQAPSSKLDFKKLGMQIGERAGYSQSRGRVHAGRDIAIREGTPLRTISDAVIVDKGYEPTGYGHWIIYRDKNGREHMYGHMQNESKFKKGDKILANTIIGSVGSTGRSTGPHLHWEVSNKPGEVGLKRNNVTDPIEMGYSASSPFGGEKNPKPPKPSSPSGQSSTNVLNASGMSGLQLSATIKNIKPGQKVLFSGVGSVQGGKDWLGKPQTKYFDTQGNRLSEEEFTKRFKNSKLKNQIQSKPSQPSKPPGPVPSANLPNRFSGGTIQGLQQYGALQKQGGGYIGKKSPRNISSLSSYPSYSSEGGMMIAIQPMIIEKPVSVPSGQNRSIIFPIPVGVNNSNMQSLSRG